MNLFMPCIQRVPCIKRYTDIPIAEYIITYMYIMYKSQGTLRWIDFPKLTLQSGEYTQEEESQMNY